MTNETVMTTAKAKGIIRQALADMGLESRLTAKTINFTDLARHSLIFVEVHARPLPAGCWAKLDAVARQHGFRVE